MNDLIKTVRDWLDAEDATHFGDFEKGVAAILDRLTAMKTAGDGLEDALVNLLIDSHYAPNRVKARAALKQWKEASDGL